MAHGSPRTQICHNCDSYGLVPRFSANVCPRCGSETESITKEELIRDYGFGRLNERLVFGFTKIKKPVVMTELLELKVKLYQALIRETRGKTEDEASDADVNIMYELSRDPDIQRLLSENQ